MGAFQVGFNLFGSQTLGLTTTALAVMFITCSLAMLVARFSLIFSSVCGQIDQRLMAAAFVSSAFALALTSYTPDAMSLGLMIAMVATSIGMIGPVCRMNYLKSTQLRRAHYLASKLRQATLGKRLDLSTRVHFLR